MAASSSSTTVPSRSTSLPTRSHPFPASIEEELTKLKAWVSSPLPMPTESIISVGIQGLVNLHHSIDDLLLLPRIQKAITVHLRGDKYIEELLDGYVKLLDVCNAMKDTISSVKDYTRAARSALIRRGTTGSDHHRYLYPRKIGKNDETSKCLKELNHSSSSSSSSELLRKNNVDEMDVSMMLVKLLKDVRLVSVSVFRSIFSFLTASDVSRRGGRWSTVSKALGRRIKGRNSDDRLVEFEENVDGSMACVEKILSSDKDLKVDDVAIVQRRLECLEKSIHGVDDGVDSIYRRLIQNRVNILNILSFCN